MCVGRGEPEGREKKKEGGEMDLEGAKEIV